ncbi:MAG TPA: CoA pyrophosphatase [Bryobacteraceae bacterium]|nr:CoA pyrophosphatase [Bryobacteraceae bacterium]
MTEPEAAVAMIQAHGNPKSILLIRRAEREGDSWSGHWSFPGGWRHASDVDPLCTAIREMEEECGVRILREQMERPLPHTLARRKVGRYVLVAPFLFRVEQEFATVLNPDEAAGALWVPLPLLLDPAHHALRPVPGRPREMMFPSVDLSGVPLWGFTYRLITDWLELVPKEKPVEAVGLAAAETVLQYLVSLGLTQTQAWTARPDGIRAAAVSGTIPVDAVLSHFSAPGPPFPTMNCLEARPGYVRVAGLGWEEYFIYAEAGGSS